MGLVKYFLLKLFQWKIEFLTGDCYQEKVSVFYGKCQCFTDAKKLNFKGRRGYEKLTFSVEPLPPLLSPALSGKAISLAPERGVHSGRNPALIEVNGAKHSLTSVDVRLGPDGTFHS